MLPVCAKKTLEEPGGNRRLLAFPLGKYFWQMEASSPSPFQACRSSAPIRGHCAPVTPHPTPSPKWGPSGCICPLCFSSAPAGSKIWAGAPFYSSYLKLFSPPFSFSPFSPFLTLVGQFTVVIRIWRKYLLLLLGQPVTEKLKACGGGQVLSSMAVMQELWHLIVWFEFTASPLSCWFISGMPIQLIKTQLPVKLGR